MLSKSLLSTTAMLACLQLVSAAPSTGLSSYSPKPRQESQDGTTINVRLKNSVANTWQQVDVLTDDKTVPVQPTFSADVVDATCANGCTMAFHCHLYTTRGTDKVLVVAVDAGETKFLYDAVAPITSVSCGPFAL